MLTQLGASWKEHCRKGPGPLAAVQGSNEAPPWGHNFPFSFFLKLQFCTGPFLGLCLLLRVRGLLLPPAGLLQGHVRQGYAELFSELQSARACVHTHTRTCTRTQMCIAQTHTCTRTQTHMRTHTCAQEHRHACAHTNTDVHHIDTHVHT